MLWRQAIIQRNDHVPRAPAQRAAGLFIAVEIADHKTAAVKEKQQRKWAGAIWGVNPGWDLAGRAGQAAIGDPHARMLPAGLGHLRQGYFAGLRHGQLVDRLAAQNPHGEQHETHFETERHGDFNSVG